MSADRDDRSDRRVRDEVDRERRHLDRAGDGHVSRERATPQHLSLVVLDARDAVGDPLGGASQRPSEPLGCA